jgi:hypothetical protein
MIWQFLYLLIDLASCIKQKWIDTFDRYGQPYSICPNKQGFKNKETKNGDHDTVANKLGRKCRGRNGETLR